MDSSKKHYKYIDLIRVIACISVFLYHLNILKGGFLAVCTFFVLSGYLSCISAFKKEKFSFKDYYLNRIKTIYIPLIIVVFISIFIISLIPNISWLNLKPETTSVILGYNNFWQLNANLDYFARHINSPFIHLWYIAILLQFDLIFPFLYLILKKMGEKLHKSIPCIITFIASLLSLGYFYYSSRANSLMFTYYDTLTRSFSYIFGIFLGFIATYYSSITSKLINKEFLKKIIFYIYLSIWIIMMFIIDSSSKYFAISMILTTFITMRLITYATNINEKERLLDSFIKSISSISYEIYLVQYPIYFIVTLFIINKPFKIFLTIILTIIISYIIHFCLNFKKRTNKILKYSPLILLIIISLLGAYKYLTAQDYTKDMEALENHLGENEKLMQEKQQEYASNIQKEEDIWQNILQEMEENEAKLKEMVTNLNVVGIGDSVMLGAIENLYQTFPKGYFDAKISRTAWVVNDILKDLKSSNMLGNPIILNLGANGDCSLDCKRKILNTLKDNEVFWINVTNDKDVHVNDKLESLKNEFSNLHIIDWKSISANHPEYFIYDKIHLTTEGIEAYTKTIYDAIYKLYLEKYEQKKQEIIHEHEEEMKKKVSFYGNNMLINAYHNIHEYYPDAKYVTDKNYNFNSLKQKIKDDLNNNTLTYKIIFILDKNAGITKNDYEELINLCKDHEIYIVSTTNDSLNELTKYENIQIIDFASEINNHNSYLMPDQIHLSSEGNTALANILEKLKETNNLK